MLSMIGSIASQGGLTPRSLFVGSENRNIIKFDPNGTRLWDEMYNSTSISVAVDKYGNSYSANPNNNIYKYNTNGKELWNYYVSGEWTNSGELGLVRCVAVDKDGCSYIGVNKSIVKVNSSGVFMIGFEFYRSNGIPQAISDVAIDKDGFIYAVGKDVLVKYNTVGTPLWVCSYQDGYGNGYANKVAVDKDGNSYMAGSNSDNSVFKVTPSGVKLWNYHSPSNTLSMVVDKNNYIYCGRKDAMFKLSPNGALVWVYNYPSYGDGAIIVSVDSNGYSYACNKQSGITHKVDPNGNKVSEINTNYIYGTYALAVEPGLVGAFPSEW